MKKKFLGLGWKSKIILKRATAYISINKLIVDGCCLEKGQVLYSYLAEDEKGRKIIVTYLDGKRQVQQRQIVRRF
jgi:penicillin V acylase-like amidase (Ntn superfamily)